MGDGISIDPWSSNQSTDYDRIIEQFGLESIDYSLLPNPHMLHRRVTFGTSETKYGESLLWSQLVYITVGAASTATGYFMVEIFDMNNWLAWLIQSAVFGPLNFIGLRLIAFAPTIEDEESQSDE